MIELQPFKYYCAQTIAYLERTSAVNYFIMNKSQQSNKRISSEKLLLQHVTAAKEVIIVVLLIKLIWNHFFQIIYKC